MTDDEILKSAEKIKRKRQLGYKLYSLTASMRKNETCSVAVCISNTHGYEENIPLTSEEVKALQENLGL